MNQTALIIGNAEIEKSFLVNGYDEVIVFNEIKYQHLIPYITQHWVRWGSPKEEFWGADLINFHKAKVVACTDNYNYTQYVEALENKINRKVISCHYPKELTEKFYEVNNPNGLFYIPSTGFMAIKTMLDQGYNITLVGFTFQGARLHNWNFEKKFVNKLAKEGKIKVL